MMIATSMVSLRRLSCLLAALILGPLTALHARHEAGDFRAEELVCKMEPGFSVDTVNNTYGTTVMGFVQQTGCYLLRTQFGQDPESLALEISELPGVQYCGANYYLDAPEPFQLSQPFLDVEGAGDYEMQSAATVLNLTTVHTLAEGGDVKVAIIDGGVNLYHPEFTEKSGGVNSGWDFVDGDSMANDEPGGAGSGHGTFVAGVVRLVAPASHIYAYRVLDTAGRGDGYTVTKALLQAIEDGCKVVNLSLGMVGRHHALDDALKYAESQDITLVTSAGNDSTESDLVFPFPAKKASCLTVAALDSLKVKADFSNYGLKVDICAPGTRIYSPFLDTSYAWWDGTSFAAPFVTGLAALIYSIDSTITWEEVHFIIDETATNVDSLNPGLEGKLGQGLIDMVAALEVAARFSCGDADDSGDISVADLTYLVDYLFHAGAAPYPTAAGDADCSGGVNVADIVHLVGYLFFGGPAPCQDCP